MTEKELLELGFTPNVDGNGRKISYHPEGCTYTLIKGEISVFTTDMYPYLWISFGSIHNQKLISRKITKERIERALQFKSRNDIVFLGDD